MSIVRAVWRQFLRGMLPYPDLLRRGRVRRSALRLASCQQWPGTAATGMDAAQLALLRLLWLQQLTRNAVSERRGEDAALLARTSVETCIAGLYCVHSGDAIGHMSAANYRAAGRVVSYLSDARLGSLAAIDSAVEALGELGPDLNIRDLALWLDREQGLGIAARLYHEYYVPLSHLFARSYAFALMRHVHPDGSLRRRPAFPWVTPAAARLADGCMGLLAASIADKSGTPPDPFLRYATAHLDRLVTPALAFTIKGALRSVPRRKIPGTLKAICDAQRHAGGPIRADVPAWQVQDGLADVPAWQVQDELADVPAWQVQDELADVPAWQVQDDFLDPLRPEAHPEVPADPSGRPGNQPARHRRAAGH